MENSSVVTLKAWTMDQLLQHHLEFVRDVNLVPRPSELEIPEVRLNAVLSSPSYDSDTLNLEKHWLTVFNTNKL